MVANVRRAEQEVGRRCRVLFDVAGPKLRIGRGPSMATTLRLQPPRDALGVVIESVHIWLTASEQPIAAPGPAELAYPTSC